MKSLFWVSLLGACYSYIVYALILLMLPKRKCAVAPKLEVLAPISIIITAHNEQARIEEKLRNTLEIIYPPEKTEIIVASDASCDMTDDIVRGYKQKGVRLIRSHERNGKEYAQFLAIKATHGDILIFTDVGTTIPPNSVSLLVAKFADPKVGAVSSEDRLLSHDGSASGEGAYVKYEMWLRGLESSVNSLVGLSGSFFAARRELCQPWDVGSPSDFNIALNCVRHGYVAISDPHIMGYYRDIKDEKKEYRRKVRTVIRGISALVRQRAALNPFVYGFFSFQVWSHKILRWLVPWFLLLLLTSSLAIAEIHSFYLSAAIIQLFFYGLGLAAVLSKTLRPNKWFKVPFFFLQANVAIAHATLAFLLGRRVNVWESSER